RYASRARDIVNVTRVNEDPRARRIRELEEQIVRMRCDIEGKDPSYVAGLEEKLVLLEAEAQKRAADLQALEKEREKNEIHERMLRATEAMREQLAVKAGELQLQVEESRRLAEYHQSVNKSLKEEHACRERDLLEQLRGHDAEVDCIRRNNNMEFLNCQEELRRTVGDLEHERQEREVVLVQLAHRQEELKIAIQSSQQSMQVRDELLRQNSVLVVRIQEIESQNKSQQRLQHDLERFRMEHMRQEMIVQLLQAQLEEMTLRYELSSQYSVVEREVYSTWMSGLHARITLDVERQLNMYAERRNHEQLTDAMCFGSVITNIEEKGQEKERQEMLREEEIKCKGEQHEKEQKVEQVHRNIQIMGKRDTENDAHGQKKINHIEKERVKLQGHVTSIRSDMGE
ncbi:kinesin K39, putative, (fragment), partial [Trypanosoma vivax Y486]